MNYILIGDSGHAKVIEDCIVASGDKVIAKLDDKYIELETIDGYLKGPIKFAETLLKEDTKIIIAIGNNKVRQKIVEQLQLPKSRYGIIIHPRAIVSLSAHILPGTVVMPNAIVNADAYIGSHVIINSGSIVEHDCKVDDYVHIAPGAVVAGGAKVGEGAHIGPHATVDVLATVGKWDKVQAGSTVFK